jgi:alkylated DNA repair dioxygenase AlkB
MESIELTGGGILLFSEAFLPSELADAYFAELRTNCAWEQKPGLFGHMQPRLTASYGDECVTYRYSRTVNVALPWTRTLLEIKQKIEAVQGRYNYCLLNCYRSGQNSTGMHADNEPEIENVIGSPSLGATRTFSHPAQQVESDEELPSSQWNAHHPGRDDAAVLEARDS